MEGKNNIEDFYIDSVIYNVTRETIDNWLQSGIDESEIEKRIDSALPNALKQLIETESNDYFQYAKEHMHEIASNKYRDDNLFLSRMDSKWGDCFDSSYTMYEMVYETAVAYKKYVDNNVPQEKIKEKEYTFFTLMFIHGRILQIFLEILCLMKNGFADAAYARFRTMYELCCYACFIQESGEQTAKEYFKQSKTDESNRKWAKGSPLFSNKSDKFMPSFRDIEKTCSFNKLWEKQYKLGCSVIHGGPESTFGRLSIFENCNLIPVGRSDYGITTPAEHSAIILSIATTFLVSVFPTAEFTSQSNAISKWVDIIREKYFTRSDELFNENTHEDF